MSNDKIKDKIKQRQVFNYLDTLQETGEKNMPGAAAYITRDFPIDKKEAETLLLEWIDSQEDWK